MEISDTLMCARKPIYVIVEGCRPLYWTCGASGYHSKACPGKNPKTKPHPKDTKKSVETKTTAQTTTKGESEAGGWMEAMKKVSKVVTIYQQQQHLKGPNRKPQLEQQDKQIQQQVERQGSYIR